MTMNMTGLDGLHRDILEGRVSRRQVLKRSVALGLSAPVIAGLLTACGGDDDDAEDTSPSEATSTGSGPTATAADTEATEPTDTATEPADPEQVPRRT